MTRPPLTSKNTVQEWLDDAIGGGALRDMLTRGGKSEADLHPVRQLSLRKLAELGSGSFPPEMIQALVAAANGGHIPAEEHEDTSVAPLRASSRFEGKTIIVTGAGSGIGRATAERIVTEGGRVVAVDVTAERLEDLAATAPRHIVPVVADITDLNDIARIMEAAGSRIDGLANVAGIMDGMTPLHETDDALWRRIFAVNVDGTFNLSRAVLPLMMHQRRGVVVNVASEASFRGNAAGTAYTASKHAVVGLTKSAAFLYGPSGVRTNAVAPGPTATRIESSMASPLARERLGQFMALIPPVVEASTIAASVTWLLSSDSDNVNGVVLASDGGWSVQ